MREFKLNSGTTVVIDNKKIMILREDLKNIKGNLGRAKGKVIIRLSAVSGIIKYGDYLLICVNGLPLPKEFKSSNIVDVKQYPNCIVGTIEEVKELFYYINDLL